MVWLHTHCLGLWPWLFAVSNAFSVSCGPNFQVSSDSLFPQGLFIPSSRHPEASLSPHAQHRLWGSKDFIFLVTSLSYSLMLSSFILGLAQSSQKALSKVLLGALSIQSRTRRKCRLFQFSLSLHKMPLPTGTLAHKRRRVGTCVFYDPLYSAVSLERTGLTLLLTFWKGVFLL